MQSKKEKEEEEEEEKGTTKVNLQELFRRIQEPGGNSGMQAMTLRA